MKRMYLTSLLVMVLFFMASAQKSLPGNFYLTKLENGLDVLVIEDNSVPLATIEIVVRNGSYTEDKEYNGLSHLYEHMFFKANSKLPSQEAFLSRVNELGIVFNGTTSDERVNYFLTLSTGKVREGLSFINDAIRYPLFLEEEMKKENPVVDGEFQRAESNPVFWLFNDMNKNMWGENYSRKNAIGNHDIILSATPEKMRVIQKKYYYPNNSIVVIAGDVKHEEMFESVKAFFGDWQPSSFDIFKTYPIPEFTPLKESIYYITENKNAKTPIIMAGLHGPDTRNDVPSTYAADVFSYILSQKGSKFYKDLVDEGLAFQVNVSYQTCKYVGPIQIFLVPNPTMVNKAFQKLLEHMNMWSTEDYFTDEQIETAKTMLAIDHIRSSESTSSHVHTVTYWWASANLDYYSTYIDNLKKVTRTDIQDYVKKYIIGKPMVTGLLVSPEMKEKLNVNDLATFLKQ